MDVTPDNYGMSEGDGFQTSNNNNNNNILEISIVVDKNKVSLLSFCGMMNDDINSTFIHPENIQTK